jgi:hypothetical protein
MRQVLRSIVPVAACLALLAPAANAAPPRAHAAAQKHAERALAAATELRDGRGVRTGRELTDALREVAVGARHLRGEARERAHALLARPTDPVSEFEEAPYTVPETAPVCSAHFCVHYVTATADAASAAWAATVLAEAEKAWEFETGTLGWDAPPSDGTEGGDARTDIYLKELSHDGLFGYAASDPGQRTKSQFSYLVVDNDFLPSQYGGAPALESLQITLAHEYAHVLQYGYDILADGWHYESSAVWVEQRMHPTLDDWLRFVNDGATNPGWRSLTEVPLTGFDHPGDPRNAKPYGTATWNLFLSGRYGDRGDRLQQVAWELSDGELQPSTHSYDAAIEDAGGAGLASEFASFAAAAAEWQAPQLGLPFGARLPEVERLGGLVTDGEPVSPTMDHLTFALYDVPATDAAAVRLAATFPRGTRGAVALVARDGAGGPVTTRLAEAPDGGAAGVTLERPYSFTDAGGRITAVLVNADASHGSTYAGGDWPWSRDRQRVAAAITSTADGPAVTSRSPAPGAGRAAPRAPVTVAFSEDVSGVDPGSFSLHGPDGRAVRAAVSYTAATRTATLVPAAPLADTTRYEVRLTDAIADAAAVPLAPSEWSFTTVRRNPRGAVSVLSKSRRAVLMRLRSSDRDRLRWVARLVAGGRTIARRSGPLAPGRARFVTVPARGRARVALVVELRDPQANRTRIVRALRLHR